VDIIAIFYALGVGQFIQSEQRVMGWIKFLIFAVFERWLPITHLF
jgi:hypothetical protein